MSDRVVVVAGLSGMASLSGVAAAAAGGRIRPVKRAGDV